MKTFISILFFLFLISFSVEAQLNHVALDIEATDKGILIPRLTKDQKDTLETKLSGLYDGLLIFEKESNNFYHWDGTILGWSQLDTEWNKATGGIFYDSAVSVGTYTVIPGVDFLVESDAAIGEKLSIHLNENSVTDSLWSGSIYLNQTVGQLGLITGRIAIKANGNLPSEIGPDDYSPEIILYNNGGSEATALDFEGEDPIIQLNDSYGKRAIQLHSNEYGFGSSINLYNKKEVTGIYMNGDYNGAGSIQIKDTFGLSSIDMTARTFGDENPEIRLYKHNGQNTITIDGDYQGTGDGRIITQELEITGGSDVAEYFDISSGVTDNDVSGLIVSIDDKNPGKLTLTKEPYDKRVVGVISGAKNIQSGLMLGQKGSIADGDHAVSLVGRVYVKVTNEGGSILAGDFITTSSTPGYGMKARKKRKSRGAIIGKALTPLDAESGYVLVLLWPH